MRLCRAIIQEYGTRAEEFLYYETLLEKIENNVHKYPDISIEASKSLIEGICKTILIRLDGSVTRERVDKEGFQDVVKKACWQMHGRISMEEDFIHRSAAMINRLAHLRNSRGDISHGRAVPKEEFSSALESVMIMNTTDAIVHYLLSLYFKIDLTTTKAIQYDDNSNFNENLDDQYSLEEIRYSRALFDQDRTRYLELLRDYNADIENNKS